MSDKELLEFAAKALGFTPLLCYESSRNCLRIGNRDSYFIWRPLTDNSHAFKLAVEMNMRLELDNDSSVHVWIDSIECGGDMQANAYENIGHDKFVATRRAIVRCAAEIGRNIQ